MSRNLFLGVLVANDAAEFALQRTKALAAKWAQVEQRTGQLWRWNDVEKTPFHLTTLFMGNQKTLEEAKQIGALTVKAARLAMEAKEDVVLSVHSKAEYFGRRTKNIMFLGVDPHPHLFRMSRAANVLFSTSVLDEDALEMAKAAAVEESIPKSRAQMRTPHITLARSKPRQGVMVDGFDEEHKDSTQQWLVEDLVLITSEKQQGSVVYQVEASFPLWKE